MLHTPEGVRDIYNGECSWKRKLEERLHHVFSLYGFEDIETPSFEFFDVFNKERGSVPSREMYKLFDREGNTLVLRPDLTPSVARCAAKYFKEENLPIRLCYSGSTFINHESHKGKLNEVTQLGAELINDASTEADAEMLALTVEALKAAGLTEFQVEVGHGGFLNGLMDEAACTLEERCEIKMLMESKNIFGLEELLEKRRFPSHVKELFLLLPELFGDLEDLLRIEELVKNDCSLKALERLKRLQELLGFYGLDEYITFDLGMLSRYDYYTGIILKAYTYGTGEPVAKGGRYDQLVGQFGKQAPAIGVAIVADQLLLALERQKISQENCADLTVILYQENNSKKAVSMASALRKEGKKALLTSFSTEEEKEELCRAYEKKEQIEKLMVL